jgi:radical SAM-linked protein
MPRMLVHFAKRGRVRFISHLDTLEVFKRAFRRAGLPVTCSRGNNPQPRLSILHPLPVGTESIAEYLNVEIDRAVSAGRLRESLAREMPEGIEILSVRAVHRKFSYPRLELVYRVEAQEDPLPDADRIRVFLSRESIPLVRTRKGRERQEDIRPFLREIRREGEEVRMRIACVDGKSVRPEDVMGALHGRGAPASWRVLKLETAYGDR